MQYMKDIPNVNLGIINNVSTNLALAVGNEIIKENNCRDILRLVQEQTIITYKFFEKKEAKYLIIFVSEIGSDIAAQVAQLFMKSMPKVIEVEVKCFDSLAFINLYNQGEFDKNQILFIATTINLGIDFKSIIAIEDIVDFEKNNQEFINGVRISFKAIANQYNITIPISEIAYIYDYVLNNYKTDMSIDEI